MKTDFIQMEEELRALQEDPALFEPDHLRRRLEVLDLLEAHFGDPASETSSAHPEAARVARRAGRLRGRIESANAPIYAAIRHDIQQGTGSQSLLRWIEACRSVRPEPAPGLSYDALDELIAGVLQMEEPENAAPARGPEQVFYQPTPVRHILRMIEMSQLCAADVLVDFGSGLGQVCLLTSILTGARAIGIELEAAYVEKARACADQLHVDQVKFLAQDARAADLGTGTVFYLYTPFVGSMLQEVLDHLRGEGARRKITVCTLGPCTPIVAAQSWLRGTVPPRIDSIAAFVAHP